MDVSSPKALILSCGFSFISSGKTRADVYLCGNRQGCSTEPGFLLRRIQLWQVLPVLSWHGAVIPDSGDQQQRRPRHQVCVEVSGFTAQRFVFILRRM